MKFARRHPVSTFLVLALLVTYVVGIAFHLAMDRVQHAAGLEIDNVNDLLMRFGPSLAGLLTAWLVAGRAGVLDIVRRITRVRAPARAWLLAVLLPPALTIAALLLRGYGPHLHEVGVGHILAVFATQLVLAAVFAGLGEELGWRGFMLPTLAARMNRFSASMLVALGWLAWHLPAYVLFGKGDDDPFLPFVVMMVPLSLLLAWTYYRSREGLLLPILLHGSLNASFYSLQILYPKIAAGAGFQPGFDWTLAVLWLVAAGVTVLAARALFLRR